MKRACIFVFYDADGVVDDYNIYNLKQLKTVCEYVVAVVNGKINPEGRAKLIDVCDDMFVRHNEGYDTWAWREGIDFIGWDEIYTYDELVLTNDSMFGPFYSLETVFKNMADDPCDFWGVNRIYEDKTVKSFLGKEIPMPHKPEFVSSNFRVIRSTMLKSYEFRKFWDNLPEIKDYWDASVLGEWQFSYSMVNAGFTFQTLCKGEQRGMSPSPSTMEGFDQISRLKVPYVRKKSLMGNINELTNYKKSTEAANIINYIRNKTDYNIDLIYQNIIRKTNLYNLHHRLSLTSILPKNFSVSTPVKSKIAIIFHAYYTDIFPKYVEYIKKFPVNTEVFFTVSADKMEEFMRMAKPLEGLYKIEFIQIENIGRDVSAMLIGGRDIVLSGKYDYICFMHDKKGIGAGDKKFSCIGVACSETCFENTCGTVEYVNNVINLFDSNPRLGIAFPPPPTHAGYFVNVDGDWGHENNIVNLRQLFIKLDISVPFDPTLPPIAPFGSVFWFRPEALKKLFLHEWKYDDFPREPMKSDGEISHAIERSHAYIAQSEGFYPAMIINDEYASAEMIYYGTNLKQFFNISVAAFGKKWCSNAQIIAVSDALINGEINSLLKNRPGKVKRSNNQVIKKDESLAVKLSNSRMKKVAKKIVPHFIWEKLRKKKCEQTGELYIKI